MLDCSKKQSNKFICAGHGTVQYVLSLDEVGKERLTSHECAWEKQIDYAGISAYYCVYRATIPVIEQVVPLDSLGVMDKLIQTAYDTNFQ